MSDSSTRMNNMEGNVIDKPLSDDLVKVSTTFPNPDSGAVASDKSLGGGGNDNDIYGRTEIDPAYRAKAHLLNEAIADIGMGKYQVRQLFSDTADLSDRFLSTCSGVYSA